MYTNEEDLESADRDGHAPQQNVSSENPVLPSHRCPLLQNIVILIICTACVQRLERLRNEAEDTEKEVERLQSTVAQLEDELQSASTSSDCR